jgi:quercetin dioxygenase-like cupin family protein
VEILPIPRTARGAADWFTGEVWSGAVIDTGDPARLRASNVRFTPGSRTTWHRHKVGQTLLVSEGIGLIQIRGGDLIRMRAGDVIYIEPGEWHWHGATPDSFMVHLALLEGSSKDGGGSENGPFVTDEEYRATPARNA